MAIKLIVTDLDGTFFDSDHVTIPERNIEAYRKAHEAGVKVAVASGRPKDLTDVVLAQVPFIDYLVTSNGAVAYDMNKNETISSRLISNAQTLKILEILDNTDLPYEIYYKGGCYISEEKYNSYDSDMIPEHFLKIMEKYVNVVKSLPELIGDDGVEKINIMCITPEIRTTLEEKIRSTGEIYITSSISGNMEMNSFNADKGFAVRSLAESMNIGSESVMCFGDGENDVEMLRFADWSFAMENGSQYAKNAANYTALPNDKCGVADAIEKYVLGKNNG